LPFPSIHQEKQTRKPKKTAAHSLSSKEIFFMLTRKQATYGIKLFIYVLSLTYSFASIAADDGSLFATGGYARGIRSDQPTDKISDHSGVPTRSKWIASHEKIFTMIDKKHAGVIDAKDYISATGGDIVTFATGGYARGLRSKDLVDEIDANRDGKISHDEFIAYITRLFDKMDTTAAHKGNITKAEVTFATGGYNRTQ
jgi:hypothetical protein